MTPHLVADEIRSRGRDCVHIVSWGDYDRLRKVPAGIDPHRCFVARDCDSEQATLAGTSVVGSMFTDGDDRAGLRIV
jgi:hypothetical protein